MVKKTSSRSTQPMDRSNITIAPSEDLQEAAVDKDQAKTTMAMSNSRSNTSLTMDSPLAILNITRVVREHTKESDLTR